MSSPEGKPWVNVERSALNDGVGASELCASLGAGYTLITNAMWQTIARNIETAQSAPGVYLNWSNSTIGGANAINTGHGDLDPSGSCDGAIENVKVDCLSIDDAKPQQKRTHTLSNNEVIWDIAGNVTEWVLVEVLTAEGSDSEMASKSWDTTQNSLEGPASQLKWGPTHSYLPFADFPLTSGHGGLGYGYLSVPNGTSNGAYRGGGNGNVAGLDPGIFTVDFSTTFVGNPLTGFRCALVPE